MAHNRILRERVAGQSAMSAVVAAQAQAPVQHRFERLFGASPLTPDSRESYQGALGELIVGDTLENLGPSWDVLHDLPVGDTTLDHLLIGRPGVFTVSTVNYGRRDVVVDGESLVVDGDSRDDIRCARAQADRVALLLGDALGRAVRVRPILVVVGPRRLTSDRALSGVRVVGSSELERVLSRAPRTLTGDEVASLSDVADLASTWPEQPSADLDTQQLNRDFGQIRNAVRDALVRRVAWAAASTLVVYTTVCSVVATFVSIVVAR